MRTPAGDANRAPRGGAVTVPARRETLLGLDLDGKAQELTVDSEQDSVATETRWREVVGGEGGRGGADRGRRRRLRALKLRLEKRPSRA